MLLSCLFLILGYKTDAPMKPGYWTYSYSDSTISFDLDYSYDAVFILGNPESSSIKVRFLDMIEYQTISPQGFGFVGQFLTNVEITSTTNETHSVQLYILPKDYCSHNYLTYYSISSQLFHTKWNENPNDHFQVCYLYQSDREDVKLTAKLNSDFSNASYAYPEDYKDGTFNGHDIQHSENINFDLKKGLIIRLQGNSHIPSKFDLTVKPFESSKNESASISSLPFYYVVSPDGYNFLDDVHLQFEIKSNRLVDLTASEIGGIATSTVILVSVVVFTLLFVLKRLAWCCYNKHKRI